MKYLDIKEFLSKEVDRHPCPFCKHRGEKIVTVTAIPGVDMHTQEAAMLRVIFITCSNCAQTEILTKQEPDNGDDDDEECVDGTGIFNDANDPETPN